MNSVVRVGDTVRRIPGNCTPTIHRLLVHVRERGVIWVPAPLGYDDRGREILTFIPGEVPHEMPQWVWSDVVLADVARSLRQWHDATIGFDAVGSTWGLDARDPPEVICHNDFAPYNMVFTDGRLTGVIDFDYCSPGPRIWDIAYLAYRLAPLSGALGPEPFSAGEQAARLGRLLAAYGSLASSEEVVATAVPRLRDLADFSDRAAAELGNPDLTRHADGYRADADRLARGQLTTPAS